MYVRFVVSSRGEESGSRLGVVHAVERLLDDGLLEAYEATVVKDAFAWLDRHLPVPTGAKRKGRARAISWFKDSAAQAIEQMWSMVSILREHGVSVEVVRTANAGGVLYEDEWQVFAVPLKDRNASS